MIEEIKRVVKEENDKMAWVDALIALMGWTDVYYMLCEKKGFRVPVLIHKHLGEDEPGVMFSLCKDYMPTHSPWYWKPALYDALTHCVRKEGV